MRRCFVGNAAVEGRKGGAVLRPLQLASLTDAGRIWRSRAALKIASCWAFVRAVLGLLQPANRGFVSYNALSMSESAFILNCCFNGFQIIFRAL